MTTLQRIEKRLREKAVGVANADDAMIEVNDAMSILREELPTALTVEEVDRMANELELDGSKPLGYFTDDEQGFNRGVGKLADRIKSAITQHESNTEGEG